MTTISIQLDDKHFKALKAIADREGKTIPETIQKLVAKESNHLNDLRKKAAMAINNNENSSEVSEEDFDAVADFLIEDNLELLKRLA